jgi:hypothetical protein
MPEETVVPEPKAAQAIKSYKELKKRKKPVVTKVPIAMDSEQADEYNEAYFGLQEIKGKLEDDPRNKQLLSDFAAAKEKVADLHKEIEGNVVEFVFRSVGRRKFEDLLEECPATPKQKADASKRGEDEPSWDSDTFPVLLMTAAVVSPEITEEEFYEIWESEDWNQAELMSLFLAALQVNQQRKVVELGKEFG